jgi:small subunit ribosomal protein S18
MSEERTTPSQGRPPDRPQRGPGRPPGGPGRPPGGSRPPQRRRQTRRRYSPRRKVCAFCLEKTKKINYKDIPTLRRFITDRGKIKSRRKTGTCARHQRRLAIAVKRARHLALLPFTADHVRGR